MNIGGTTAPSGNRGFHIVRADGRSEDYTQEQVQPVPVDHLTLAGALKHGAPQPGLDPEVNAYRRRNARNLWRGLIRVQAARALGLPHAYGAVHARVVRAETPMAPAKVLDYGLVSMRVVTDAGVAYMVDAFQNLVELEAMKYHGFGTGTTAEAASQTALVTELTTQYVTDNVRPTGSQTEGAANVYRSVGTHTAEGTLAITEHGLFSASSAGTMLDRSMFSALNLVVNDALTITYDFTVASGS